MGYHTSIYFGNDELEWLRRDGLSLQRQVRQDSKTLQRIIQYANENPTREIAIVLEMILAYTREAGK